MSTSNDSDSNGRLGLRGLMIVIGLLMAVLSVGLWSFSDIWKSPLWLDVVSRLLVLVAIFSILLWKVRAIHKIQIDRRPPDQFPKHKVPLANANSLMRRAGKSDKFSADEVMMFAFAIVKLPSFRQRVVDTYVPDRRTIRQRVTIDCQIPKQFLPDRVGVGVLDESPTREGEKSRREDETLMIYHPLSIPSKGKLQDSFRYSAVSGCAAVSVLSYPEYLQLAACSLRLLLRIAFGAENWSALPGPVRDAERDCVQAMLKRADGNASPVTPNKLETLKDEHPASWNMIKKHDWFDMAITLARKLTDNYAIVAVIEASRTGRFSVAYEQTLVPGLNPESADNRRTSRLRSWLRITLGARPVDLTIRIENASTSVSYHLEIEGADGLYLSEQRPMDMGRTIKTQAVGAPTLPHLRFRKRLGQPHAHFYTRYFPEPTADEQPQLRFRFEEVPPGVLLRAVVAACSALALIWMVGLMSSGDSELRTDAPAFLLAFPVIAAAWLGFESPARRLLEGTLTARCSLLCTAAECLTAVGVFMGHSAFKDADWWQLPWGVSVLWISDVSWSIVLVLAILNAAYVCYKYWLQTYTYMHYSSGVSDGEIVQNG